MLWVCSQCRWCCFDLSKQEQRDDKFKLADKRTFLGMSPQNLRVFGTAADPITAGAFERKLSARCCPLVRVVVR